MPEHKLRGLPLVGAGRRRAQHLHGTQWPARLQARAPRTAQPSARTLSTAHTRARRVGERKHNAAIHRKDAQQRAIKKQRKSAAAAPAAAEPEAPQISKSASDFLSQMRGEVSQNLEATKKAAAAAAASQNPAASK